MQNPLEPVRKLKAHEPRLGLAQTLPEASTTARWKVLRCTEPLHCGRLLYWWADELFGYVTDSCGGGGLAELGRDVSVHRQNECSIAIEIRVIVLMALGTKDLDLRQWKAVETWLVESRLPRGIKGGKQETGKIYISFASYSSSAAGKGQVP